MSSVASPQLAPVSNLVSTRMRPELELLLTCSRSRISPDHAVRIQQLLSGPLRWNELSALGQRHGLIPLLYQNLSPFSDAMGEFWTDLQTRFQRNARQALWLTQLSGQVLEEFDRQSLQAMPFKGPVLAEALYGNVVLRQFSDLDFLVRPSDVVRAKIALEKMGFSPNLHLTPREEKAHIASGYEYVFDSAEPKSLIEIQWRIVPRFYAVDFDTDGFFQRAELLEICGRRVLTLAANDLVLVLCVHAAKHLWEKISWICDIAQLSSSRTIDWDSVLVQASALGIKRIVATSFFLAHELLGSPMPPAIRDNWQSDPQGMALGAEILNGVCEGWDIETDAPAYFRLMLRLRERSSDRQRFLSRLIFTPTVTEWRTVRLPGALFPAYRLVRIGRLLSRPFKTWLG